MKRFLHVGCGYLDKTRTTPVFAGPEWEELRVDIDPAVAPAIVASITDLSVVESGSMDALYSSHNIEHLFVHEVPTALAEFRRVLKPDGYAVITCPDLKAVARLVADDRLDDVAYNSSAGPITPLDILFGFGADIRAGRTYMAHRCGFTARVLMRRLEAAGFGQVVVAELKGRMELWAVACAAAVNLSAAQELLTAHVAHRAKPATAPPTKG